MKAVFSASSETPTSKPVSVLSASEWAGEWLAQQRGAIGTEPAFPGLSDKELDRLPDYIRIGLKPGGYRLSGNACVFSGTLPHVSKKGLK